MLISPNIYITKSEIVCGQCLDSLNLEETSRARIAAHPTGCPLGRGNYQLLIINY